MEAAKPPLLIHGHHGLGDNLHQRPIIRQLLRTRDVWLESSWAVLYHDLISQGLKILARPHRLRTQLKNVERERERFSTAEPHPHTEEIRIFYNAELVRKHGSVVGAMFGSIGLEPVNLDFRLPVSSEWVEKARAVVGTPQKPILVYRPLVVRKEWRNEARNPDHASYAALFMNIRDKFHVVSIADLEPAKEWVVGEEVKANQTFHSGELDFETLAGLFSISSLVYSAPGFAVVLAQAVGTPAITVFGGYENSNSFSSGGNYSPWCPIEPIKTVDDFSLNCKTDKLIDMDAAKQTIAAFFRDQKLAA